MQHADHHVPGDMNDSSSHSPRRRRADFGIKRGPLKPRQPAKVSPAERGEIAISLSGTHGQGKSARISRDDALDVLAFTESGKRLHVVESSPGASPIVRISGPAAQAWAKSPNPKHSITLARFLVGETHAGRRVRFKDHDPFNLTRDNLVIEVPALTRQASSSEAFFPIDWDKAEAARKAKMATAVSDIH